MTKITWPRMTALAVIVSIFLFIGLTWLWYFAENGYHGMTPAPARRAGVGDWGFVSFSWPDLMVLGLMHLSFWVLFIAGIVWLVQLISDRS